MVDSVKYYNTDNPYGEDELDGTAKATIESVLVTNSLDNPLTRAMTPRHNTPFFLRLGRETENTGAHKMKVSSDGGKTWHLIDKTEPVLKKGWHKLVAEGTVQPELQLGIKVQAGARGCEIMCLQA